ncbi:MAG: AMP-binding protein, partial [Elainella sp.]
MVISLIDRAADHAERLALVTPEGSLTYRQLLQWSGQIAVQLLNGVADLQEQRVAFLVPAGFEYVAVQWGIWRAGGLAVPLCVSHPRPELDYVIANADASVVIAHPSFADLLHPIAQSRGL